MAGVLKKEGLALNKKRVLVVMLSGLFLIGAAILMRVVILKPAATVKLADIPAGEYDPAVWGRHYPKEYQSYLKTKEMSPSPTGFGGSEKVQKSVKEPEILTNFKGMPFSVDYSEDRGHPYALDDLKNSKRINETTPGSCMTCKTPNLIDVFKEKGWGYAKTPLKDLLPRLTQSIACANCHDPATMNLRVINPAFIEAMNRRGIDVTKATREEMRGYVCGQCHVEYYFAPADKKVIFPWGNGLKPDEIYAYYAEKPNGFEKDWQHPDSKALMLKAQHPDFEIWSTGVHAKSGVSCPDCHMSFNREDGVKYTSHWVTSPMMNIKQSCRPCHTQSEDWLLDRVKTTQNNVWQLQHIAGQTIAKAHRVIELASLVQNYDKKKLDQSRELIRKSQWFWDIVAAENSMGFHNPSQVENTLGQSIDLAHQAITNANEAARSNF
jgi:nitrite reductase (cytochrome c-552)